MTREALLLLTCGLLLGCGDTVGPPADASVDAADASDALDTGRFQELVVDVTLDGVPSPATKVVQGGNPLEWTTDEKGRAVITVDRSVTGDLFVMASHPDARINGNFVPDKGGLTIPLTRFSRTDNPAYVFQDPGEPTRRGDSSQCAHCHVSAVTSWIGSAHRTSAKNPIVQDLYSGTATAFATKAACEATGGRWWSGTTPGTGTPADRCYLGDGVLPALDGACGKTAPCDTVATKFGACADCHAPGIDGKLGGRSLLEARGHAYEYGVHCDVCHRTESIDLAAPAGVGGRLRLLRPSEKGSPALGPFAPLTFGPWPDVINPRMGSVQRDHFDSADLCAGCHEHTQPALVAAGTVPTTRWPDGRLPVHTTYGEWKASPMSPSVSCQVCHMPADSLVWNGADLQLFWDGGIGVVGGWRRLPGHVRLHAFDGPRTIGAALAGTSLAVTKEVVAGKLTVKVKSKNTSAGHAIPTGDPLRALILVVEARCGTTPLVATGGDAVPDFGGFLAQKPSSDDWTRWTGAKVGDLVRVVRRTGKFQDYAGYGPFGDGTFSTADKGLPVEEVVGTSKIVSVTAGVATFDPPLPKGDLAYRVEPTAFPAKDGVAGSWAGASGFAFARVMVGPDGRRMVPHFLAVDVASDNRLLPFTEWPTTHEFAATCTDPVVRVALVHRPYPLDLARERGWAPRDLVFSDVTK